MCELFEKKSATGRFAASTGTAGQVFSTRDEDFSDSDPPGVPCNKSLPSPPPSLTEEEIPDDNDPDGSSLPATTDDSSISSVTTPSKVSSINRGQKRKRQTGVFQVASALDKLAASTDRIVSLQKSKSNKLEEAVSLAEAGGLEEEELMQAMEIFLDERKAVIFCTLSPAMRHSWLRRQIISPQKT